MRVEIQLHTFLTSALDGSQLHAPSTLPPGKQPPWYSLDRRLGGPQSRSGCGDDEKNSFTAPTENQTLVVQTTA